MATSSNTYTHRAYLYYGDERHRSNKRATSAQHIIVYGNKIIYTGSESIDISLPCKNKFMTDDIYIYIGVENIEGNSPDFTLKTKGKICSDVIRFSTTSVANPVVK